MINLPHSIFNGVFKNTQAEIIRETSTSTAFGGIKDDETIVFTGMVDVQNNEKVLQKLIELGIDANSRVYMPDPQSTEQVKTGDIMKLNDTRVGMVEETDSFNSVVYVKLRE